MKGRYRIGPMVAAGSQSIVYSAFDAITQQECFLKAGESVRDEALLLRELSHPFAPPPFDLGEYESIGTYAAYLKGAGGHLGQWLKTNPLQTLKRIVLQVVEFLAFLHHRGWLYNDFKPEHFLITEQEIRIVDFGLCSRLRDLQRTYSGTFPCISPERLTGRSADARSDIFSLGMMLLQLLLPEEPWDLKPSVNALQQIQRRVGKLHGFWRSLISQMTALEPSQRLSSAQELWNLLLPHNARRCFLFFPLNHPALNEEYSPSERSVRIVESSSSQARKDAERVTVLSVWKQTGSVVVFDLRENTVEFAFKTLCSLQTGQSAPDFLTAVSTLKRSQLSELAAVFHIPTNLSRVQISYLFYALSTLESVQGSHFLIVTPTSLKRFAEESWDYSVVSRWTRDEQDRTVQLCFPGGVLPSAVESLLKRVHPNCEALLSELQRLLPSEAVSYWPVAARVAAAPVPMEQMPVQERRALAVLSVAGGSLDALTLRDFFADERQKVRNLVERLASKGHVREESGRVLVSLPVSYYLKRFRKSQIKEIAADLLPAVKDRPKVCYRVSLLAGKSRAAAAIALRVARTVFALDTETGTEWFWRAFRSGATFPKRVLFRMIRLSLLRSRRNRSLRLLKHWRSRFGGSYRWADQALHFFHRTNNTQRAIKLARKVIEHAGRWGHTQKREYFSARMAGFLLTAKNLPEAEALIKKLSRKLRTLDAGTRGLVHHHSGLLSFYRGNPAKAISHTRNALAQPHPFRLASLVNLGIFYGRLGKREAAERFLRRAVDRLVRKQDMDWLSHALNNFGLVLKQKGEIEQARECYSKSSHLSRAGGNSANMALALENIAVTYSLEGRTAVAIRYHQKAARIAEKAQLEVELSYTLTNMGLQYAILGRFTIAFSHLQKAAAIRKKHGLMSNLAGTSEYLGLAYYLAGQYEKARKHFHMAESLFREGSLPDDSLRTALYAAVLPGENNRLEHLASAARSLKEDSFEMGLWKYVEARWSLHSEQEQDRCRKALHEAERIFRKVPSLLWLAAVHELKADYYLKTEHLEKAALSLQAASHIYLRLGARKSLLTLAKGAKDMKLPEGLLDRMMAKLPFKILLMIRDVLREKSPDEMISKILTAALEFTDMERAVLILAGDPPKIFRSTVLDEETVREICEISYSAVESATGSPRPFVCLNASQDSSLKTRNSIVANRIMSVVCLPLWNDEQLVGYLYLDSREGVETMVETESVLLEIFASIMAMTLTTNLVLQKSLEDLEGFRSTLGLKTEFPEIVGSSTQILEVIRRVHPLISSDIPVLITGETGTGKELIARILHYCGKRKTGHFVTLNCSALNEGLLENELFGHEKGAYTGADEQKKGLVEQGNSGTLFLDEVGEMPRAMQARLLRVLEDGEYRRVGGTATLHTNARIVLATNTDVVQMVKDKTFREDLYFRIKGARIHLPPLRERKEDIPLLASFFLKSAMTVARKKIRGFVPEALEMMKQYSWPGNVRQLKMEVERIVAFIDHDWVQAPDLDPDIQSGAPSEETTFPAHATLHEIERELILSRLAVHQWSIAPTARSLGLTRNGLHGKMKTYNIHKKPH